MSRLVENVNLDDLYRRTREIKENRIKIYQNILQRTHKKIKYTSRQKHNDHFCFYIVPEFLVGVPTYDIATCISYLIEQLTTNGFIVKYTHPNLLFISWKHYIPAYERIEIKKKFGVRIDGFGNVLKEKKQENAEKLLLKGNVKMSTNKVMVKKDYKPIDAYKPTGNLIYGNDLIKKISTKST
jgi:hypothetical protein